MEHSHSQTWLWRLDCAERRAKRCRHMIRGGQDPDQYYEREGARCAAIADECSRAVADGRLLSAAALRIGGAAQQCTADGDLDGLFRAVRLFDREVFGDDGDRPLVSKVRSANL